jgi:3-oxoacyl-[acyl-carrier-protein] synthase-3
MFSLEHACYFVSNKFINVEQSYKQLNISQAQAKTFSRIYGIQQISVADDYSIEDFLICAVKKLVSETNLQKNKVKVLIHAHTAKVINLFGSSIIKKIQDSEKFFDALTFGMSLNNCASTLDAMELAAYFLKNHDQDSKAIVICGEKAFTPSVQLIPNTSLTSDAASACLINLNNARNRIIAMHSETHGQYAQGIWMDEKTAKDFEKNYIFLLMGSVNAVLKKASIKKSQLKMIIPHNVNLISWVNFSREFSFDRKKIYLDNVKKYAHCFGSDLLINYSDIVQKKLLQPGDYYLMATVGLGATFSTAIFQY